MENGSGQLAKNRTGKQHIFYGIVAGLIVYVIIGSIGLYLLRICWADYAIANKDKSYTFEMLLFRLLVGIFSSVIAGAITTKITSDRGKTAWFVGAIVFCVGLYIHFLTTVWGDYPIWYHFAYVLPILPITGLSHYLLVKATHQK